MCHEPTGAEHGRVVRCVPGIFPFAHGQVLTLFDVLRYSRTEGVCPSDESTLGGPGFMSSKSSQLDGVTTGVENTGNLQ